MFASQCELTLLHHYPKDIVLPVPLARLVHFTLNYCLIHSSDESLACAESRGGDVRILSLSQEQKTVELSITLHKVRSAEAWGSTAV